LGIDTMSKPSRMGTSRAQRWSAVTLCIVPGLYLAGCGFEPTPAAQMQTAGTASSSTAGTTTSSAGTPATAAGTDAGGSSAGSSPMPVGGDAGSAQGGQVAGGTGGAAAGSGGFSVAGGPPVFSSKPMSVVAYSPYRDGQAPGGVQPSMAQVREDLELLKPFVDGVRVYGTDGANSYVPALCDELGIDLHIGAWIDGIASDEPNVHALATVVKANHPSIKTAIVGNEVLARSADNLVTEARLIELINIFKADIAGTTPTYKIAAADTYPQWMMKRPNLAAAVDIVIWHTYGWWSGVDIDNAYTVVSGRYDDMMREYPGKPLILGETGWPSMYDRMSTDKTTTAVGNEANQAKFYKEALLGMRARNLPMWMFSAIDEQWKGTSGEGAVGAYWGIWTTARQPKAAVAELMNLLK
jgi:glucan 1,3-beta-glucosidase